MRDSTNTDPIFVSLSPDWSREVRQEGAHDTALFTSRAGFEQRQRNRHNALWRISYSRGGESRDAWAQRWARIRAEYRSVCIVPFWTEGTDATRARDCQFLAISDGARLRVSADAVLACARETYRLATPLRGDLWRVGNYAYVSNGTDGRFQKILEVRIDRPLRLAANGGAAGIISYKSGFVALRRARGIIRLELPETDELSPMDDVRIYPCLPCRRVPSSQDQLGSSLDSVDENMVFESL